MAIIQTVIAGGGSAPAHYIEKSVDANGVLNNGSTVIDLTGVTDIANYVFYYAYAYNANISSAVNMSEITAITGSSACSNMFASCSRISSVDLSSLTTVSGNSACISMFNACTGLTSISLGSLTTVSGSNACGNMFFGCSGITSVDLSSLTTISGGTACNSMFNRCTNMTTVNLNSLSVITGSQACMNMFYGCTALTSLSFPAITTTSFGSYINQFNNMCQSIPSITLHFPSNVQSVIEGLTGYSTTAPFGATSGTVLFDLPATA